MEQTNVPVIVDQAEGYDSIIMESKNNSDFGAIMLRSTEEHLDDNGFYRPLKKVGLFKGRVDELKKLVEKKGLKAGDNFSSKVAPVKLVIQEQFEPFYEGQDPKINPTTGQAVTSDGAEVYRQTFVTSVKSTLEDKFLPTDRVEITRDETVEAESSFQKEK